MKNIIPKLRETKGWSQEQLAKKLDVSRQTVNAIEKERYDPSLPLAFKISEVFELSIEAIFQNQA
ncbi:helix-turn-helix transcriptional regulator [Acinetobacter apis]|uniref:Putative transcriptional regulator n=1 Tax=Acinetobacter apis TaxID=1229165 RepID=A0A217EIM8_9GAMM|nr:helix-turn-helix transcriptional regulator [Acinetobacter apis]SNQ30232.1 putative transcriptional regulator [Acinetobacter apis]